MTTVINTPPAPAPETSTSGLAAIIITVLILGSLFFVFYSYALPMLRANQKQAPAQTASIKVEIPSLQPTSTP